MIDLIEKLRRELSQLSKALVTAINKSVHKYLLIFLWRTLIIFTYSKIIRVLSLKENDVYVILHLLIPPFHTSF